MKAPEVLSRFASSDGTKTYEIRRGKDGEVYCTCPAWRFSGRDRFHQLVQTRTCKHLEAFNKANAVPAWLDPNRS